MTGRRRCAASVSRSAAPPSLTSSTSARRTGPSGSPTGTPGTEVV